MESECFEDWRPEIRKDCKVCKIGLPRAANTVRYANLASEGRGRTKHAKKKESSQKDIPMQQCFGAVVLLLLCCRALAVAVTLTVVLLCVCAVAVVLLCPML